jgi:hypothetical protein
VSAEAGGPVAWVLNLDAEEELADPGYTPPAAVRARLATFRDALARTLPAGDVVLDRDPDAAARARPGRAWCPTPKALRRLAEAAARVPEAPPVEVLRRVNERGFAWTLERLPDAVAAASAAEAERALARPGRWLAKRGLTFAGRGQRRIDGGSPTDADRAWIRASLRRGPVYVEPRVEPLLEVSLHGHLHADGGLRRGRPTVQEVDPAGQWRRSRLAAPDELTADERRALAEAFERVAERLRAAGYFGPFGLDAFRWRAPDGGASFHPLSEINARYSMGWPVGMGGWR